MQTVSTSRTRSLQKASGPYMLQKDDYPMYKETTNVPEEAAWGKILADAARHIANALQEGYGANAQQSWKLIQESFLKQLEDPGSTARGGFVRKH
ncbi:DUF5076 domain-containing protein [Cupriavidus basilensis]|uniref:DUF5076 domain-containing protein n=1 Tax=Cupriavidus basilensis TaxID=68895 RepID=UPI0023E7FD9D|nr:DUF5076 domain-containing protein [Cupriavidus basilensis]MDF3887559.1 DUF5076 domain-containing protein [Cupriavidus basilensis]